MIMRHSTETVTRQQESIESKSVFWLFSYAKWLQNFMY